MRASPTALCFTVRMSSFAPWRAAVRVQALVGAHPKQVLQAFGRSSARGSVASVFDKSFGAALLLLALGVSLARAEGTPEPRWQHASLNLQIQAVAAECPTQANVATWVNELTGRTFVVDRAVAELTIRVVDAPNGDLSVNIVAEEQTPAGSVSTELRHFQRAFPCAELLRAAALTISLFAEAPQLVGIIAAGSEPPEPATPIDFPDSEIEQLRRLAPNELEPSSQSNTSRTSTNESSAALNSPPAGQMAAEVRGSSSRPAPSPSSVFQRPVTFEPGRNATNATNPIHPAGGETRALDDPTSLHLIVGASAYGAMGMNPGGGLGANAHVGWRWSSAEFLLRGAIWQARANA
jgi:hypothetical protein